MVTPQAKAAMTRRRNRRRDTAYHEAGHIVWNWLAGWDVSSVWLTGAGRTRGTTQTDAIALLTDESDPEDRTRSRHVLSLMADAVDRRRGVKNTGGHIIEVSDEIGGSSMRELLTVADRLVGEEWSAIEDVATRLDAGDDYGPDHLTLQKWRRQWEADR